MKIAIVLLVVGLIGLVAHYEYQARQAAAALHEAVNVPCDPTDPTK